MTGQTGLGEAIRRRRRGLGLSQEDLAALANVSPRFLHAVETGKTSVQLDKVDAVLAALGLHLVLRRGQRSSGTVEDETE